VELPRLQKLFETYRNQGFEVVAVDAFRDTKQATKFIEDKGLSFTLLENGAEDAEVVSSMFGVSAFPTSLLVDREGRVMYAHVGFELGDEQKLEEEIRSLL
jgi:peroxiredoxin